MTEQKKELTSLETELDTTLQLSTDKTTKKPISPITYKKILTELNYINRYNESSDDDEEDSSSKDITDKTKRDSKRQPRCFSEEKYDRLEERYYEWCDELCRKYPKDSYIPELKVFVEFTPTDIISYIEHFSTLNFSEHDMKEAIKQLHVKAYMHLQSVSMRSADSYYTAINANDSSYVLLKFISRLITENTELLLRPNGPVSIELAKKFIENSDKQQNIEKR